VKLVDVIITTTSTHFNAYILVVVIDNALAIYGQVPDTSIFFETEFIPSCIRKRKVKIYTKYVEGEFLNYEGVIFRLYRYATGLGSIKTILKILSTIASTMLQDIEFNTVFTEVVLLDNIIREANRPSREQLFRYVFSLARLVKLILSDVNLTLSIIA